MAYDMHKMQQGFQVGTQLALNSWFPNTYKYPRNMSNRSMSIRQCRSMPLSINHRNLMYYIPLVSKASSQRVSPRDLQP